VNYFIKILLNLNKNNYMKTTIITALMLITLISSAQTKRIENGQLGNVTIISEINKDVSLVKVISLFNAKYYLTFNAENYFGKKVNIVLEDQKILAKKRVKVYEPADNIFVKINRRDLKSLSIYNIISYELATQKNVDVSTVEKVKEIITKN